MNHIKTSSRALHRKHTSGTTISVTRKQTQLTSPLNSNIDMKKTTTNAHLKCYSHVIISCSAYKQGYSKTSPPGRIDASTGCTFKKLTRPARKGRTASTWEVDSERTHPLPLLPTPHLSLLQRRARSSRAPTAEPATRLSNPYQCYLSTLTLCSDRSGNVYAVICFECDV